MKIKRYIVKNMKEACDYIREDLGSDAVIVSSRKVREKGIRGFFSRRKLEVIAAVDDVKKEEKISPREVQQQSFSQEELQKIKLLLKNIETPKNLSDEVAASEEKEPSLVEKLREHFLEKDINVETTEKIIQDIENDMRMGFKVDKNYLTRKLATYFKTVTKENQKSNVLAFVGPPGVGKTTTIAKLGSHFALFNNMDIGLITIDTYRIGAVQQIETYGQILDVEVDVVMTPAQFKRAVEKNRKKDVVLIDTAGRPSNNTTQIAELKTYLDSAQPLDIYLVLSSQTKDKDLMRMLEEYRVLKYDKLIFTKIDETEYLGSIVNASFKTGLPIAYVTNGQSVPDDINAFDPMAISELILGDVEI